MPISNELLDKAINRAYVVFSEHAQIGEVFDQLLRRGGQAWWAVVVIYDDESFGMTTPLKLEEKRLEKGWDNSEFWAQHLSTFDIPKAPWGPQKTVKGSTAEALAEQSPAEAYIVLDDNKEIIGIVRSSVRDGLLRPSDPLKAFQEGETGAGAVAMVAEDDEEWFEPLEDDGPVGMQPFINMDFDPDDLDDSGPDSDTSDDAMEEDQESDRRYLNIHFARKDEDFFYPEENPLVVDTAYDLHLNIGKEAKGIKPTEDSEDTGFPDDVLEEIAAKEYLLTVVVSSDDFLVNGKRSESYDRVLPRSGVLQLLSVPLQTGRLAGRQMLSIDIFYRGPVENGQKPPRDEQTLVLLWTEQVSAMVALSESETVDGNAQERRVTFKRVESFTGAELDPNPAARRWVLRYMPATEKTEASVSLFGMGAERVAQFSTRIHALNLETFTARARELLFEIAQTFHSPHPGKPEDAGRILGELAYWGHSFYLNLFREDASMMWEAWPVQFGDTMQLALTALPDSVPWSTLYERPINRNVTTLCRCFADDSVPIPDGDCPANCPDRRNPNVVCPAAFWGYRYILEQVPAGAQTGENDLAATMGYQIPNANDETVFALLYWGETEGRNAFQRVDEHRQKVAGYAAPRKLSLIPSLDPDDAPPIMNGDRSGGHVPHIIHFYVHGHDDKEGRVLVMGNNAEHAYIGSSEILEKVDLRGTQPLVVLTGCQTGGQAVGRYSLLTADFLRRGACGVLATECTVFENIASYVANQFFRRFFMGERAGEVLLKITRHLMQARNPYGLVYSFYANADLRLRERINA